MTVAACFFFQRLTPTIYAERNIYRTLRRNWEHL